MLIIILIIILITIATFFYYNKSSQIYLDNNGTTFPYKEVVFAIKRDSHLGNSSAIYANKAKQIITQFKSQLREILNCPNHNIIITSCGSESNNLMLRGTADSYKVPHFLLS